MMPQPLPHINFFTIHLANDKNTHPTLFYLYYCDVTLKHVENDYES